MGKAGNGNGKDNKKSNNGSQNKDGKGTKHDYICRICADDSAAVERVRRTQVSITACSAFTKINQNANMATPSPQRTSALGRIGKSSLNIVMPKTMVAKAKSRRLKQPSSKRSWPRLKRSATKPGPTAKAKANGSMHQMMSKSMSIQCRGQTKTAPPSRPLSKSVLMGSLEFSKLPKKAMTEIKKSRPISNPN